DETARTAARSMVVMTLTTRAWCALALLFPLCAGCQAASPAPGRILDGAVPQRDAPATPRSTAPRAYARPSTAELKQTLNRIQFEVTQHEATEPPFRNEYW